MRRGSSETLAFTCTRHAAIEDVALRAELVALYERSHADVGEQVVSREVLTAEEADAHLRSGSAHTWIAWHGDRPVALASLTGDVLGTTWLNGRFLAERYPGRAEHGRLLYVMMLGVDPDYRDSTVFARLMARGLADVAADGGVLAFDVPADQPGRDVDLASVVIKLARRVDPGADAALLSTVRYYAVDFAAAHHVVDVRSEDRPVIELPVDHHDDVDGERVRRPA